MLHTAARAMIFGSGVRQRFRQQLPQHPSGGWFPNLRRAQRPRWGPKSSSRHAPFPEAGRLLERRQSPLGAPLLQVRAAKPRREFLCRCPPMRLLCWKRVELLLAPAELLAETPKRQRRRGPPANNQPTRPENDGPTKQKKHRIPNRISISEFAAKPKQKAG